MAKVTIKTDVAQAAAAKADAQGPVVLTDALGRELTLREIGPLQESRLVLAVGSEAATNAAYMFGYVMPACLVGAIDGDPLPFPQTKMQIEGAIQRVGKGIEAVLNHLQQSVSDNTGDKVTAVKN